MECPKCQTHNTEDSQFCRKCATPLPEIKKAVPTKTLETLTEELTRGSVFAGRYEIIEELGKGGMGNVYRVFDKKVDGEIALKLVKPEIASDKNTLERFRNELKLARDITHKNVCRMYDLNEDKGTHYITMEYVPGGDLKRFIRRSKQLGIGTALSIAKQICEGLVEAHRLGVVHRDLKPNNIMIDDNGNARIMDFGIARSLSAKGITGKGVMIGTPEYMSPEQVEGKEVDQRSDIYSLGIIMFEMVTGRVPFEGDMPFVIGMKHKSEKPKEPKEFNLQIPEDLNRVILKCLEKEKENRYQNSVEVLSVLNQIEQGIPTTERAVPKSKPITSKEITVRFTPKKVLIPAAFILLLAIVAYMIFRKQSIRLDPNRVVVALFENRTGDEANNQLIQYTATTITEGISQTGMFDVVPFDVVMHFVEASGESDGGNQGIPIIRQLARETGAGTEITGYVSLIRDMLSFHVEIIDISSGQSLVPITNIEGSSEEQEKIVDELSDKISGALAAHFNYEYGRAYDYTPPLYSAFREYLAGQELFDIDRNQSIMHLENAIELDTTYNQPYIILLHHYMNGQRFDDAKSIINHLSEKRDQLSLLNRHRLETQIARLAGNIDEVAYHYQEALKLDPGSRLLRYLVLFWAPYANRPGEAIKTVEAYETDWVRPSTRYPERVQDSYVRAARAYHMLSQYKKELNIISRGEKHFPGTFHEPEARAMVALGKIEEAKRIVEKSRALSSQDINPGQIMFAIAREMREHGHFNAYKEIANQTVDWYGRLLQQKATDRLYLNFAEALYLAVYTSPGNWQSHPTDYITCVGYIGVISARKGNKEKALRMSAELENIDYPYLFGRHTMWRARIASLLGQKEEAYRLLRESLIQGRGYGSSLIHSPHSSSLFEWHDGQNPRLRHENINNLSSLHEGQRTRANPHFGLPQSR